MDISGRLEKLERENRRTKKIGIVAAVVVSCLIIGGQAKTNKVVETTDLRLVDRAGKVRVEIFFPPDSSDAQLLFRDADGNTDAELGASSYGRAYLNLGKQQPASMEYISLDTGIPGFLSATLTLGNAFSKSNGHIFLSAGQFNSVSVSGSAGIFSVNTDENLGPSVTVTDKEGYSTSVGRADLETTGTGRKTRTPAASVVLFGKDKKVLWSAP